MRKGSVWLDLPRHMALHTPVWLARANIVVWVMTIIPLLLGYLWAFAGFLLLVAFNFGRGYLAWRQAGRPAIDDTQGLAFRPGALKSLWPTRKHK